MPLLDVRRLVTEFATRRGVSRALDGISFTIEAGEILGVVGESGAGKSLAGVSITGLLPATARVGGGEILFEGERIDNLPERRLRAIRGRRIGTVFQDATASLNPLYSVGWQLVETMQTHLGFSDSEARRRAIDWIARVGIPDPAARVDAYPHELSGGMRQRVVLALALCAEPRLLIADEPTTALDVSIQAQIIGLIKTLTREQGTAVMLITHDLGVVAEAADRVAVMYAGRIVEIGPVTDIARRPAHPYTEGLMASIPSVTRKVARLRQIDGVMPRLDALPGGCAFWPRCPSAFDRCRSERPDLMEAGGTRAACWLREGSASIDRACAAEHV